MRRNLVIMSLLVAVIIVAPTMLYFGIFQRPIKASSDDVLISQSDLPSGWIDSDYEYSEGDDGVTWAAHARFTNESISSGNDLYISILSWDSVNLARDNYLISGGGSIFADTHPLELGDDGVYWFARTYVSDPNGTPLEGLEGNYSIMNTETCYLFREGNVVVIIMFGTQGDGYGLKEPWMDDIARIQWERVHQHNGANWF
ncbi:MAG: hypothetical protein AB9819_06465 [Methanomassiliicoccales archaeon]